MVTNVWSSLYVLSIWSGKVFSKNHTEMSRASKNIQKNIRDCTTVRILLSQEYSFEQLIKIYFFISNPHLLNVLTKNCSTRHSSARSLALTKSTLSYKAERSSSCVGNSSILWRGRDFHRWFKLFAFAEKHVSSTFYRYFVCFE
jgi:hypothetical protein